MDKSFTVKRNEVLIINLMVYYLLCYITSFFNVGVIIYRYLIILLLSNKLDLKTISREKINKKTKMNITAGFQRFLKDLLNLKLVVIKIIYFFLLAGKIQRRQTCGSDSYEITYL